MTRKQEASLITYNTKREEFESMYERNKFYRGLFGYTQKVKKNGKTYEYEKKGLMDEIPNVRIDDSVFIISKNHNNKVKQYFKEWEPKISHHIFTVLLKNQEIIKQIQKNSNTEQLRGKDDERQPKQ